MWLPIKDKKMFYILIESEFNIGKKLFFIGKCTFMREQVNRSMTNEYDDVR